MIRFNLICDNKHEFDGWFSSSDDFDGQKERGLVTCPMCDSAHVSKAIMAPKVTTGRMKDQQKAAGLAAMRGQVMAEMKKLRDHVEANCENVGRDFAEEARKMHYGEREPAGIYGEASAVEAKELVEEGVEIAPLPTIPDDAN